MIDTALVADGSKQHVIKEFKQTFLVGAFGQLPNQET